MPIILEGQDDSNGVKIKAISFGLDFGAWPQFSPRPHMVKLCAWTQNHPKNFQNYRPERPPPPLIGLINRVNS